MFFSHKDRQSGFSLTELSVAIAIISVIAGSAISVAITSDEAAKIKQTSTKMDAIEDAIVGYFAIQKRLPCPAEPYWNASGHSFSFGVEAISGDAGAPNPATCGGLGAHSISTTNGSIEYGTLPITTLGLPDEYYKDGWGRPFVYVVDTRFANNTTTNATPCDGTGAEGSDANSCFLYATGGDITVNDAAGDARTTSAVLLLMSLGPNGHGAYFANGQSGRFDGVDGSRVLSADELENSHFTAAGADDTFDATFVQKAFIKDENTSGQVFDDIVRFMTRDQVVKKTGAVLYQKECVTAATILANPGSNDCTPAANEPICESFAQQIDSMCLQ